ncbi:sensor histidine kinase [Rhodoferax saidenbachensis]|uniref:histidine kinase n=1 Tax=Rhodoferax saidenbachensis TaxID=1484693 RepID=A0A1P8KBW0_9BURK|nr:7TM diverse intracellular signaling domain-containing protein [Rhodoferax saidenbachensis]APW43436.1 ATP-binding protein [Rhodoferax saidenbachensis]
MVYRPRLADMALALLVTMALSACAWLAVPEHTAPDAADTPLHLTQADWQVEEVAAFSTPALSQDSHALAPLWQPVALPLALPIALLNQAGSEAAPPAARVTWLRLAVPPLAASVEPWALYAARIKTDGTIAVYLNGRLAHRAQAQGPLWNSTRMPLWLVLDNQQVQAVPVYEILLRVEHSAKTQVAVSSLWLGPEKALRGRYDVRHWLQLELPALLSAAFLAVGVFALFIWLQRRRESGYLLFFALAVASCLRSLHFYVDRPVSNDWFAWLTVNSLFWLVVTVHLFLRMVHRRPQRWLNRCVLGATLLVGVLTLPALAVLPNTAKITPLVYALAGSLGAIVVVVGGVTAWRTSPEGRLVVGGFVTCILFGLSDWLLQNNFVTPESLYFGAYANAVTFLVFGGLMYRRYILAISEVEALNAHLADRLQAREAELELSHQRLREVEMQQTLSDERQRLMQDMHDGLGSSLISAIRSVEHGGMSDAKVSQILKDCLDDLKLTIDSMEPVEADLLLLLATLRFRLEPRLEGTGIQLDWQVQELPTLPWLDPSSALHILRIVQESIANILRHTRATQIRVGTALEATGVRVTIEDNGQGFDVTRALARMSGRGLQNQRRRAQAIQGTVEWLSGGTGTVFSLWLPLERADAL